MSYLMERERCVGWGVWNMDGHPMFMFLDLLARSVPLEPSPLHSSLEIFFPKGNLSRSEPISFLRRRRRRGRHRPSCPPSPPLENLKVYLFYPIYKAAFFGAGFFHTFQGKAGLDRIRVCGVNRLNLRDLLKRLGGRRVLWNEG